MPSMLPCPKCGEYSYHKSHTKNFYERIRKNIFKQRPYRCHDCSYRGWSRISLLHPKFSLKKLVIYLAVFFIAVIVSIILKGFIS